MNMAWLCLILWGLLQEPPDVVREFAEKLGSESPDVRQEATQKLKSMGKEAVPLLRPLALHADPEVRSRARAILETLPPELALVHTVLSCGGFAFSPDENLFAHYSRDGKLTVLSTVNWGVRFAVPLEGSEGRCAPEFSPDGKTLFALVTVDRISAIPVEEGGVEAQFPLKKGMRGNIGHPGRIIVGNKGPLMVVAGEGVFRWFAPGYCCQLMTAGDIVTDPFGDRMIGFASSRRRGVGEAEFVTYDPRTSKIAGLHPLGREADFIAAPAKMDRLYVGGKLEGEVGIYSPGRFFEELRRRVQPLPLTGLAVSPDGAWVLTADREGKVRIFGAEDLSPLGTLDIGSRPGMIRVSGGRRFVGVEIGDFIQGKHLRVYRNKLIE